MKKASLYILLAVVLLTSCKKFLDVNDNPNSPTKPPINGLLGQVTYSSALNVYRVGSLSANYVQRFLQIMYSILPLPTRGRLQIFMKK